MTRVFLDTKYNGQGGQLISMALVTEHGEEWYQVAWAPDLIHCDTWVWTHVVPFLGQTAIPRKEFLFSLEAFLKPLNGCEIIADWPADFAHLSECMAAIGWSGGRHMPIECNMRLMYSGEIRSAVPHNALSDARGLRDWHMGLGRPQEAAEAKVGDGLLWW